MRTQRCMQIEHKMTRGRRPAECADCKRFNVNMIGGKGVASLKKSQFVFFDFNGVSNILVDSAARVDFGQV